MRFDNGADVGLRLLADAGTGFSGRDFDSFRIGPVAGITRPLGSGFIGRMEGNVLYGAYSFSEPGYTRRDGSFADAYSVRARNLTEDVSATVGRRIPIIGSVAFQPALGGFVVARQRLLFENTGTSPDPPDADYSVGVQIEIPITFRLFGRDAAIAPVTRFSLKGAPHLGDETIAGGGFRLNL